MQCWNGNLCSLSLFCHLMLEIQSFIAVDGLGKEKQMFHGHHFTLLLPRTCNGTSSSLQARNLSTRIESLHGQSQRSDQICLSLKVHVGFFVCFVFRFTIFFYSNFWNTDFFFNYTYSFNSYLPKPFWLLNVRRNHMCLTDFRAAVLAAVP